MWSVCSTIVAVGKQ